MTIRGINKSELKEMYEVEQMSMRDIAEYYVVSLSTIQNYLKKFEIKTRTPAEGTKLHVAQVKKRELVEKIMRNHDESEQDV